MDFCVACCPELKLPGCSQEICISLQVAQNKRRKKRSSWFGFRDWVSEAGLQLRYRSVPLGWVADLVWSPAASLGLLRSGSDWARGKERQVRTTAFAAEPRRGSSAPGIPSLRCPTERESSPGAAGVPCVAGREAEVTKQAGPCSPFPCFAGRWAFCQRLPFRRARTLGLTECGAAILQCARLSC